MLHQWFQLAFDPKGSRQSCVERHDRKYVGLGNGVNVTMEVVQDVRVCYCFQVKHIAYSLHRPDVFWLMIRMQLLLPMHFPSYSLWNPRHCSGNRLLR